MISRASQAFALRVNPAAKYPSFWDGCGVGADRAIRCAAAAEMPFPAGNSLPVLNQISWHLPAAVLAPGTQTVILNLRASPASLFQFVYDRFLDITCAVAATVAASRHADQAG
jgi:hypothetical protein